MARLSITLFGPLQVALQGETVRFESDKVRALLAYLVVESEGPHRREKLAGLLWPDWPESSARNNLRHTLAVLRKTIGDREASRPALDITRQTVQFCTSGDVSADVTAFAALLQATDAAAAQAISRWEQAIDLYQGDFLQDFSLPDSPEFEEWALLSREQFRRQAMDTLYRLAEALGERGEPERALQHAWRQTELDPLREEAHLQAMRLLALSGRRSEALAQYRTCRRLLAAELGVDPAAETTALYEQIRDGSLADPAPPAEPPDLHAELPSFLDEDLVGAERPIFVARERELAQLEGFLKLALAGQGQVVFVTGDAGSGKTALIQEFARRAQGLYADLVVAGGHCNAQTGVGDPYLPFREVLELLTGDVEARWAAGAMTREQARRLWNALPLAAQALAEAGPDLIDTFVHRSALLKRARAGAPDTEDWLTRQAERVEPRPTTVPGIAGLQQGDLFDQYTRVLQALARQSPLLLAADDLQWADLGSISLLFHLGRQLAGSPILIVGAYRPEELTARSQSPATGAEQDDRHPLEPVVHELQRIYGDISVDLGQAESRGFVDALLDAEPNRLGTAFREMLYRRTRGHPLFSVELLRGLQEQGDLVLDSKGRWVEGPALNWERLPARVEAVIAERMARLAQHLRGVLQVACVEGPDFTAEVVARVLGSDEREIVRNLSSALDRRHRLVRVQALEVLSSRRVSRYRFRHSLFQKYLYDSLDPAERAYLHEDVGTVLEAWHGDRAGDIALELARHFQEARMPEKAIHYLRQAGDRAVQLCAYQEGIAHLTRALDLLKTLPVPSAEDQRLEHAQQELDLQLSLGMAWKGDIPSPEGEEALTRARELCQKTGRTTQLCRVLGELSIFPYVRAEYQMARDLCEEALSLAEQTGDPLLVALNHWHLGYTLFSLGEFTTALNHLQQVISFYQPQEHHHASVFLRGVDVGVGALAYDACCLWCLGYPDQALARSQESLALARELDHPFSQADAFCFAGCLLDGMRRDAQARKDHARELADLSEGLGLASFWATGICYEAAALTRLGGVDEDTALMRESMAARQSTGARCHQTGMLGDLAEAQTEVGEPEIGLATLEEALALVEETDERYSEAELHRLRAECLRMQGDDVGAEASFRTAIEVARRQEARSWELRAATGLARLWQQQGRADEARSLLAGVYGWFSEGFDTPDLVEARALIEELS